MEIKLERLKQPGDLGTISKMINTRVVETAHFDINMEDIDHISLASFNALVKLYVKLKRMGKGLTYIKCHSERMKALIHKTQLSNVFITD